MSFDKCTPSVAAIPFQSASYALAQKLPQRAHRSEMRPWRHRPSPQGPSAQGNPRWADQERHQEPRMASREWEQRGWMWGERRHQLTGPIWRGCGVRESGPESAFEPCDWPVTPRFFPHLAQPWAAICLWVRKPHHGPPPLSSDLEDNGSAPDTGVFSGCSNFHI